MNVEYGIKNFRVFDKDGARFALKPITMLTGANCAGKSSLVKSIMLLKQYLDKAMNDDMRYPGSHNISFTDQSININGIDTVVNNKSDAYKDVVFTLGKNGATDNVKYSVEYTFSSVKGDYFNNGWLKSIRFSCEVNSVSEVFLYIIFEDYLPVIKTLDLSGNIQKAFKRDLDLKTYLFHHNSYNQPDRTVNGMYDEEKRSFEALINRIYDNPLNSTLPLYEHPRMRGGVKADIFDVQIMPKEEQERLDSALSLYNMEAIGSVFLQELFEKNNLFYLPALETIGNKNAAELKAFLLSEELVKELFPIDKQHKDSTIDMSANDSVMADAIMDYTEIVNSIIDDFSSSKSDSFKKYFISLAEKQLAHMNNCEAPQRDFYKNVFLKVVSALLSLPLDVSRSGNVRSRVFDDDNFFDIDINLSLFQKVYYVLSCLQRNDSKGSQVDISRDVLEQPLYKLSTSPFFIWDEKSWAFVNGRDYKDVPIPTLYHNFVNYLNSIISELCRIEEFQHISQYDSFLCPVRRNYSVYDKTPLNTLLVEYIGHREQSKAEGRKWKIGFIDKWVKELGIGQSVIFELNKEKTDIKIHIKDFTGNKVSSADLGHGVTQMLSILINIERHIFENGGCTSFPYTICIEEPEVSLHPSWQSALGRIFYDAAVNYGIHFILETHSEYLIRSTQAIVARTVKNEIELKSIPFRVYYIENGGKAYDMEYQVSGRFKKPFGTGFFDEAGKSSLEIIRKERRMANGKDA